MFHDFDLNLLVYLDSLLTVQSVSKAGNRSHITQSAMSLALTRLRKHFEDELLVPIAGRKMALTPLAESLIIPVREAIMKIDAIKKTVVNFSPVRSKRTFVIDASSETIDLLLHKLIVPLSQHAPAIQLVLHSFQSDQMMGAKHDIVIAPQKLFGPDVFNELLLTDTWTCIAWSENNLIGDELTLKQYSDFGYVFSGIDAFYSDNRKTARRMEIFVPETSMIPAALMGTNRLAILSARLAKLYAKQYPLRMLSLPVESPELLEYMQWHHTQDSDPGAAWFRSFIKDMFLE
jgi:LysR family transcriptional regulator, nod-box dependent transcriptional activator